MQHTNEIDTRARREHLRWLILYVLQRCTQDVGASEVQLGYMLGAAEGLERLTRLEMRTALTYLMERELIHLDHGDHLPHWRARLTRFGTDVVEYTVSCEAGIARPPKEWT